MGEEKLDPKPSEDQLEKQELPEEDLEKIQGGVGTSGLAKEQDTK